MAKSFTQKEVAKSLKRSHPYVATVSRKIQSSAAGNLGEKKKMSKEDLSCHAKAMEDPDLRFSNSCLVYSLWSPACSWLYLLGVACKHI